MVNINIYQNLYDLIHNYVFGGVALSPNADLVITLISTLGCLFLISIPFIVLYKAIQLVCGR